MTLYYAAEDEVLVENHGESYARFVEQTASVIDEDALEFDLSEDRKKQSLIQAAEDVAEDLDGVTVSIETTAETKTPGGGKSGGD